MKEQNHERKQKELLLIGEILLEQGLINKEEYRLYIKRVMIEQ